MVFFFACIWCVILSAIDFRHRRLPDVLTLPGAVVINLWALFADPIWILGGLGWAALYLLTAVVMGGIGGGDIKFALGLGTVAATGGMRGWVIAVVGASALTLLFAVLVGVFVRTTRGESTQVRDRRLPHGPGMALATIGGFLVEIVSRHGMGWVV